VGDAIEVNALRQVYGSAQQPWCALGSIKSQIGHTKAAAGAAGLIKAALALYHKVLPPTIKVQQPAGQLLEKFSLLCQYRVSSLVSGRAIRAAPQSVPGFWRQQFPLPAGRIQRRKKRGRLER
jgi:hypothetical protein